MDWTFWVGIVVIAAIWGVTQWVFSLRRHSEKMRGRNREAADAMLETERGKEKGRFWSSF